MNIAISRGRRIRHAMSVRGFNKAIVLAAELNVSVAAVSKWQNDGPISLDSAATLAETLDVSLDWLLLGRGTMDCHKDTRFSISELELLAKLRLRPESVGKLIADLVDEIPLEKG